MCRCDGFRVDTDRGRLLPDADALPVASAGLYLTASESGTNIHAPSLYLDGDLFLFSLP